MHVVNHTPYAPFHSRHWEEVQINHFSLEIAKTTTEKSKIAT